MKARIHFHFKGRLFGDSFVVEGSSVDELREQAEMELAKRDGVDSWSEIIEHEAIESLRARGDYDEILQMADYARDVFAEGNLPTTEKSQEMVQAAKPLMDWLSNNCRSHCKAIVETGTVSLEIREIPIFRWTQEPHWGGGCYRGKENT